MMLGRLTMTNSSGDDTEDPVKGVDQAKDQAEQSGKGETNQYWVLRRRKTKN